MPLRMQHLTLPVASTMHAGSQCFLQLTQNGSSRRQVGGEDRLARRPACVPGAVPHRA